MVYVLKQKFQQLASDGTIGFLKEGTKIDKKEGDKYLITQNRKVYQIDALVVENNPDFFEKIDLQTQLQSILKKCSKNTAPKTAKVLNEFLQDEYLAGKEVVETELLATALEACRQMYLSSSDDKWLVPISRLDWDLDAKGVFKKD